MNLSRGRKLRIINWLLLYLSVCLLVLLPEAGQAQQASDRKREFLDELSEYGKSKARWFLKEREGRKYTLQALGVLSSDEVALAR